MLNAFATQLAVALEGRRLQAEAAKPPALAKANELRTALLAAVSHDLRTPLASIKAAATSLLLPTSPSTPSRRLTCCRRSTTRPTGSTGWSGTCST